MSNHQPPPDLERRLATILCADVAGYSRMMGENEERTVRVFRGHREIFESLVAQHRGRIFNTAGDALLAEFSSAVEAVRCATDIQAALRTRNEHLRPEERLLFRIGINLGDVIVQGGDLLGDGVNVAARIQAATEPGGICISGSVHEQIQNKLSLDFKLLGEMTYKNIAKPIRTYTINEGDAVITRARAPSWKVPTAIALAVAFVAGAGYWGYGQLESQRAERARVESQLEAQKLATAQAQRLAEDAKRDAQAKATQSVAVAAATRSARFDGNYAGQLCNRWKKPPECWPVAIEVRNGIAEGNWPGRSGRTSRLRGTLADDGTVRLSLAAWTQGGAPTEAELVGRFAEGALGASGKWSTGDEIAGSWHRAAQAAAPPTAPKGSSDAAKYDGIYSGRMCRVVPDKPPVCWTLDLWARNGAIDSRWMQASGRIASLHGTVDDGGGVEMKFLAWTAKGDPVKATVAGRLVDAGLEVSAQGRERIPLTGSWKRVSDISPATAGIARNDGIYFGRLCNRWTTPPDCWGGVTLAVRKGLVEGGWISHTIKMAAIRGTVAEDGGIELTLASWDSNDKPTKARLRGRLTDGAIHAAGNWAPQRDVTGEWQRLR